MSSERVVNILVEGRWVATPFMLLKKGNVFRMYEHDGSPVIGAHGSMMFRATSDPYLDDTLVETINVEEPVSPYQSHL